MIQNGQRIELLKVVGTHRNRFYALVNIEADVDTFRASIFEWNVNHWKLLYQDQRVTGVDIALLADDALLIAGADGSLIILRMTHTEVVETEQKGGFLLQPLTGTDIVCAGSYLSIINVAAQSEERMNDKKIEWAGVTKVNNRVYVVGRQGVVRPQGTLAAIVAKKVDFLPVPHVPRLSSVGADTNGRLVIGGPHGWVYQSVSNETWQDLSLDQSVAVTGLQYCDSTLVACLGGVYSLEAGTNVWQCEIEPSAEVWNLSKVDGYVYACHAYSGIISIREDGKWRRPFPSIRESS